jgi:hypothetical protein
MTRESKIPDDYRRPDQDVVADRRTCYWITEFVERPGTSVYSVIGVDGDGQHIIAEKCYLRWAIRIVDGLRATT